MIQTAIIKGFQSHQNTILELSEGVNTLIGDTDSGKSAVFRALLWLFTNRPLGVESFWSWHGGNIHVAVKVGDLWIGRKVILHKTKKDKIVKDDDYYYIGKDIKENQLRAFGNGPPPEEVTKILNLQDVNFQSQISLPFLLSQSSGKVGRFLNEAADLDIIDRSVSNIASVLRKEKGQFDNAKIESERLYGELKQFDWIDNAEEDLIELENLESEIKEIGGNINRLDKLLDDIDSVEEQIEKIEPILKAKDEVDRLIELQDEIEEIQKDSSDLLLLMDTIRDIEIEIEENKKLLKAKKEIERLDDLNAQIANIQIDMDRLDNLLNKIDSVESDLERSIMERDELEKEFHEIWPDKCPLCGK